MTQAQFWFEGLEAYQAAREALALVVPLRGRLRGLPGEVGSQLERALVSMVANVAEGAGRSTRVDRARCYAIARGSANEAGALVEIAVLYGAFDSAEHRAVRSLLLRTAQMLTGLIR